MNSLKSVIKAIPSAFVGFSFQLKIHDLLILFLLLMFPGTAVSSVPGTKLVNSPRFYFQPCFLPSGCFSEFVSPYEKWLDVNMNEQVSELSNQQ